MARLYIHTRDSEFASRDTGNDYDLPEDALKFGIRSALGMVADEINGGGQSAAVDVRVRGDDGRTLLRSVVTASVSPISVEAHDALFPEVQ